MKYGSRKWRTGKMAKKVCYRCGSPWVSKNRALRIRRTRERFRFCADCWHHIEKSFQRCLKKRKLPKK